MSALKINGGTKKKWLKAAKRLLHKVITKLQRKKPKLGIILKYNQTARYATVNAQSTSSLITASIVAKLFASLKEKARAYSAEHG